MKSSALAVLFFLTVSTCFGATPTPIHSYSFDSGTANDLVGTANGVLQVGATISGGLLHLNGTSGQVHFAVDVVPTTGPFSVEISAQRLCNANLYSELISQGHSNVTPPDAGFYIGTDVNDNFRLGDTWLSTGIPYPKDTQFHDFLLTSDTSFTTFYIDSVQVLQRAGPLSVGSTGDTTNFGNQFAGHGEYFCGNMQFVRIYDSVINPRATNSLSPQSTAVSSTAATITGATVDQIVNSGAYSGIAQYAGANAADAFPFAGSAGVTPFVPTINVNPLAVTRMSGCSSPTAFVQDTIDGIAIVDPNAQTVTDVAPVPNAATGTVTLVDAADCTAVLNYVDATTNLGSIALYNPTWSASSTPYLLVASPTNTSWSAVGIVQSQAGGAIELAVNDSIGGPVVIGVNPVSIGAVVTPQPAYISVMRIVAPFGLTQTKALATSSAGWIAGVGIDVSGVNEVWRWDLQTGQAVSVGVLSKFGLGGPMFIAANGSIAGTYIAADASLTGGSGNHAFKITPGGVVGDPQQGSWGPTTTYGIAGDSTMGVNTTIVGVGQSFLVDFGVNAALNLNNMVPTGSLGSASLVSADALSENKYVAAHDGTGALWLLKPQPSIVCPAAISQPYGTGQTVALGAPTVSDLNDPAPVVTNNAPTNFPQGLTRVLWTVSDKAGNSNSCTQVVNLTPAGAGVPPTITSNASGIPGTGGWFTGPVTANFTVGATATATSGCGTTTLSADTNGTTLSCSASNAFGTSYSKFVLHIDATPPVLTNIPAAISVITAATTGATITYTAPSVTDATSGVAGLVCSPASGTTFPLGTTPITCVAMDNAGNTASTTFNVTVSLPTAPGAPTIGTATAGNAQATVSFTAPTSNGGSPITSYTVTSSPGSLTASGSGSPITVTGLTNGTAYTFTVTATNAVGPSVASAASNSVTPTAPATAPGAPTIGTATAGNAQATVSFTAPTSNGGSPITSYTVTSSPGSLTASGSGSPITVTGLTNGTAYTFTVTATNAVGPSVASAASNSVTPSGGGSVAVAPTSLDFGSQQVGTTSAAQPITVSNGGTSAIAIGQVSITGGYVISSNGCGLSVSAGSSCSLLISFRPTTARAIGGTLTIGAIGSVVLSGTGVVAVAGLSPTSFDFGVVQVGTTSSNSVFTYTNLGIGPIPISRVTLTGTGSRQFHVLADGCTGQTLAPVAACSLTVSFAPTSVVARTVSLTVTDAAGGAPAASAILTGSGGAPSLTLGSGTYSFGSVTGSSQASFTMTNSGNAPYVINSITLGTGIEFMIGGGTCSPGLIVAPAGSCTVVVTFTPSSTSRTTDVLIVSGTGEGAGAATYTVRRRMSGR